jgi:hypothetical protein
MCHGELVFRHGLYLDFVDQITDDLEEVVVSGATRLVTTTAKHRPHYRSATKHITGSKASFIIKTKISATLASASTMDSLKAALSCLVINNKQSKFSASESSKNDLTIIAQLLANRVSRDAVLLILSRLHDQVSKAGPNISALPKELKLHIFSYLDPINATSLGLTGGIFYLAYITHRGETPIRLNIRSEVPNALDSSWEIVGKKQCKQCGIYRCELHKHIRGFFPAGYEYCRNQKRFLPLAPIPDIEDSSIEDIKHKRAGCGRKLIEGKDIRKKGDGVNGACGQVQTSAPGRNRWSKFGGRT